MIYLQMIDSPEEKGKFERLYGMYKGFMFQIANRILHNTYDAEDAVHSAFVSVAKNISKISDPGSQESRSYLAIITERKAIDIWRDRQKRSGGAFDEEMAGVVVPQDGERDLAGCIARLPARYRQVILLKYGLGYTTGEVAEMLDISQAAASKLDQRAKKKLYDLCREEEIL